VSTAGRVSASIQNKKEFQSLLKEDLAFDINRTPERRVENLVAQRQAEWPLRSIAELFVE